MQAATNQPFVRKRRRELKLTSWLSLGLLTAAIIMVFTWRQLVLLAWTLMIVGFVISGMTRQLALDWGAGARSDERLSRALQRLNARYWLGSFIPIGKVLVKHVLVGPEGVLVIEPRNHPGETLYSDGRWRRRAGTLARMFGREVPLGDPGRDLALSLEVVQAELDRAGFRGVPVSSAVLFTSRDATLTLEDCPVTTLTINQLESWAGRHQSTPAISEGVRQSLISHFSSLLEPPDAAAQAGRSAA